MKNMRKVILLILILSILLAMGCSSKQITIQKALTKSKIKLAKLYHIEEFGDKAIAFYKKKDGEALVIGIFYQEQDGWHFIIEDNLTRPEDLNKDMSHTIFMQPQTEEIPEFSLVYGIINNPQIEKVRLHMTSGEIEDRYATVRDIHGKKVWYDLLDGKKIFNIHQGISKDGQVIYDPEKAG